MVCTMVKFGHVWCKISCTRSSSTAYSSLELFNFVNAPFVLAFWEKHCFHAKSTPIPISNVNNLKTVWSRTVKFVQSKGN